jgi:predicted transcriptional regulator
MDIHLEKLKLIQWLAGVRDTSTIREFITLKKSKEADWWDEISAGERNEIQEGIAQADRGEVVPHGEVMTKYNKWI